MPTVAARFVEARTNAGLSRGQAAKLLDMHRQQLCAYETGGKVPATIATFQRFADLYGCSLEWLATGKTTTAEGLEAKLDRCDPADRAAIVRLVSTLATKGKKE